MLCWKRETEIQLTSNPVTPGLPEIVTLAEFKEHAKIDGTDEDTIIQIYIDAATEDAISYTRRVLLSTAYTTEVDRLYSRITLDVAPVDVSSIEISYYDENNVLQVLPTDNYFVRNCGPDAYPVIELNGTLPNVYDKKNSVVISYDAGYASVPKTIKSWILLQAASLYENRQNKVLGSTVHDVFSYAPLFTYKML